MAQTGRMRGIHYDGERRSTGPGLVEGAAGNAAEGTTGRVRHCVFAHRYPHRGGIFGGTCLLRSGPGGGVGAGLGGGVRPAGRLPGLPVLSGLCGRTAVHSRLHDGVRRGPGHGGVPPLPEKLVYAPDGRPSQWGGGVCLPVPDRVGPSHRRLLSGGTGSHGGGGVLLPPGHDGAHPEPQRPLDPSPDGRGAGTGGHGDDDLGPGDAGRGGVPGPGAVCAGRDDRCLEGGRWGRRCRRCGGGGGHGRCPGHLALRHPPLRPARPAGRGLLGAGAAGVRPGIRIDGRGVPGVDGARGQPSGGGPGDCAGRGAVPPPAGGAGQPPGGSPPPGRGGGHGAAGERAGCPAAAPYCHRLPSGDRGPAGGLHPGGPQRSGHQPGV